MSGFLRFVGILNAAIWCGATVFLLIGLPALFSPEMTRLLTKAYAGFAAEAVFGRYFILYYCCSAVALAQLAAEWFYSGRRSRGRFTLVVVLTALGLLGGLGLQPKLHQWHWLKYYGKAAEQAPAARAFAIWHGVAQSVNLVVIVCLVLYLWRTSRPPDSSRFAGVPRNRGLTNRPL